MDNISEYIFPSIAFLATIIIYLGARHLYLKFNKPIILQPMLSATVVLVAFILFSHISLKDYQEGTFMLSWMIAPLTIALMLPLYERIKEIRQLFLPILVTLMTGSVFTVSITLAIASYLGSSKATLLSLASKSVTTPVALAISEQIHSLPSLSALIVIITGVVGVITAPLIFSLAHIKSERAQGLTLGLSAHIIGSTYALEKNKRVAAYSIIAMSLNALISALLLPPIIQIFYR